MGGKGSGRREGDCGLGSGRVLSEEGILRETSAANEAVEIERDENSFEKAQLMNKGEDLRVRLKSWAEKQEITQVRKDKKTKKGVRTRCRWVSLTSQGTQRRCEKNTRRTSGFCERHEEIKIYEQTLDDTKECASCPIASNCQYYNKRDDKRCWYEYMLPESIDLRNRNDLTLMQKRIYRKAFMMFQRLERELMISGIREGPLMENWMKLYQMLKNDGYDFAKFQGWDSQNESKEYRQQLQKKLIMTLVKRQRFFDREKRKVLVGLHELDTKSGKGEEEDKKELVEEKIGIAEFFEE